MSTVSDRGAGVAREVLPGAIREIDGSRVLAVAGMAALTWAYVSVFWQVTNVVGGRLRFAAVVATALVLAVIVGRFVGVRVALGVTAVLLVFGFAGYLLTLPTSQLQLLTPDRVVRDTIALLTGLSILRLVGAGAWVTAIAPAPVFLSWYLATRRRYAPATAAGSVAVAIVVLTGDAEGVTTLVGVIGATVAIAAGTAERHGTGLQQADVLTVIVAAMIVASATLSVVPGAATSPILPNRDSPTVEASLIEAKDSVDIVGSIRLSPEVRFTVESQRGDYWQTAVYDRYTGDGWVRTGDARPYQGGLTGPPGDARTLGQRVTARDSISVLPAAWKPVEVTGDVSSATIVTPQGSVRPGRRLAPNESYTVTSRVPTATAAELRRAGTDYPERVASRYRQLPESTPDRVDERAAEVAGDATTPYAKAVAIQNYLAESKEYSLSVPAPTGDVADTFLFEREAGYCTYFATTMVVMLRSQGVPARFVTGYTPGDRISDDRYVVRGLNSHAWVQVYFPDVGWVRFDPTPAGPRQTAETARLTEARQAGTENVDIAGLENATAPTGGGVAGGIVPISGGGVTPVDDNGTRPAANGTRPSMSGPNASESGPAGGGGLPLPELPSRQTIFVGIAALVGLAAGASRIGVVERVSGLLSIQVQQRRDPETDVVRAYRRLSVLLEQRYRPRETGETARAYLHAVAADTRSLDPEAERIAELYERARYGEGVTADEADEAVTTVDRVIRSRTPLVRRFR